MLDLLGVVEPQGPLTAGWIAGFGALLATAGIVLTLAAQAAMGTSWRIGVDPAEHTALVTTGPFALVRNPIFSAMLLSTAGLTLLVPSVVAVVGQSLQARRPSWDLSAFLTHTNSTAGRVFPLTSASGRGPARW